MKKQETRQQDQKDEERGDEPYKFLVPQKLSVTSVMCNTHSWVRKIKEQDRVIMTMGVGLHVVE